MQTPALETAFLRIPSLAQVDPAIDYRPAVCAWEAGLFASYAPFRRLLSEAAARRVIEQLFASCRRPTPELVIVPGFSDPDVGGYADVARNRILIERGFTYAYLILHEAAHILVPEDRRHGPSFIHFLQALYRAYLGLPLAAVREFLERHGLVASAVTVN